MKEARLIPTYAEILDTTTWTSTRERFPNAPLSPAIEKLKARARIMSFQAKTTSQGLERVSHPKPCSPALSRSLLCFFLPRLRFTATEAAGDWACDALQATRVLLAVFMSRLQGAGVQAVRDGVVWVQALKGP